MMPTTEPPAPPEDQDISAVQGGAAYLDRPRTAAGLLFCAYRTTAARPGLYVRLAQPRRVQEHLAIGERQWGGPTLGVPVLTGGADWEADTLCDELRTSLIQHLGAPEAGLVIDETDSLEKGRQSAGVARQQSGTAGCIENCQLGVSLTYASRLGHALLERELWLPEEWRYDRVRCRQAGIPDERRLATKPMLAPQPRQRAAERWAS